MCVISYKFHIPKCKYLRIKSTLLPKTNFLTPDQTVNITRNIFQASLTVMTVDLIVHVVMTLHYNVLSQSVLKMLLNNLKFRKHRRHFDVTCYCNVTSLR